MDAHEICSIWVVLIVNLALTQVSFIPTTLPYRKANAELDQPQEELPPKVRSWPCLALAPVQLRALYACCGMYGLCMHTYQSTLIRTAALVEPPLG